MNDDRSILFDAAFRARHEFFGAVHDTAFRLFDGFSEGLPGFVVEVYGHALLVHDYAPEGDEVGCRLASDAARVLFSLVDMRVA